MDQIADSPIYQAGRVDPGIPVPRPTQSLWLRCQASSASHTKRRGTLASTTSQQDSSLPDRADFVIIGSGLTAAVLCNTLSRLISASTSIVVLEARQLCGGATGRNGGHVKTSSVYTDWLDRKAKYGLEETTKLTLFEHGHLKTITDFIQASVPSDNTNGVDEEAEAVECDFREHESVDAYFDEDTFQQAVRSLEDMRRHLPRVAENFSVVSNHDALARLGCAPDRCVGAVVSAAASLWPYKLVRHIFSKLTVPIGPGKRRRVRLFTSTPVWKVSDARGHDRYALVETSSGSMLARHVVHATNGYLGHLLPEMRRYISPVRGNVVSHRPSEATKNLNRSYWFRYNKLDFDYMIQRPDGQLVIGRANTGRRSTGDDSVTDLHAVAHLSGILPEVLNWQSAHVNVTGSWSGILGFTRDGMPLVGRVPGTTNQWVCAGYCGLGMIRAWHSAVMLAHLMVGNPEANRYPQSMLITRERLHGTGNDKQPARL